MSHAGAVSDMFLHHDEGGHWCTLKQSLIHSPAAANTHRGTKCVVIHRWKIVPSKCTISSSLGDICKKCFCVLWNYLSCVINETTHLWPILKVDMDVGLKATEWVGKSETIERRTNTLAVLVFSWEFFVKKKNIPALFFKPWTRGLLLDQFSLI